MVAWVRDYLNKKPQFIRLQGSLSDAMMGNTSEPQGTVLSLFLFTIYTSDFNFNSTTCDLRSFFDDSIFVGCISADEEEEYRRVLESFNRWSRENHFQVNIGKTKEVVVDF